MLKDSKAFSSFSTDDIGLVKEFYSSKLGLEVSDEPMGNIKIKLGSGAEVMIYPKGPAHQPAAFTVLTFPVKDIDQAVTECTSKGIVFLQYDTGWIKTEANGIARSQDLSKAPHMAWFTDPAGNILALMQL
jgi:predicted enzyme related to lactoylglutathione lyase